MNHAGDSDNDLAAAITAAVPSSTRLIASAITGEHRAVERLASYQRMSADVDRNRVAPLLARIAQAFGTSGSCVDSWRAARRSSETMAQSVSAATGELASSLADAGITWVLLADADLGTRIYDEPADRGVDSIDLLVATRDMEAARQACIALGWRASGQTGPGRDRALREEGCRWQAGNSNGLRLDLYFRLWQWVPEYMQRELLERSQPDPELGACGRRPNLVDRYLISAQRVWAKPRPRALIHWWDLHRIVEKGGGSVGREAYREARRAGLHLPVGLAGAVAAGLWGHGCNYQVAEMLRELRGWERAALRVVRSVGPGKTPTGLLMFARQLTGRRTRTGWRGLLRPVWAHSGTVEDETPMGWPAPLRRARHLLLSALRWLRPGSRSKP